MEANNYQDSLIYINIRFCLWKEGLPKFRWNSELVRKLEINSYRADEILKIEGQRVNENEIRLLIDVFNLTEEEFQLTNLLNSSSHDVLRENLNYLINSNSTHGEKKVLASRLGVENGTISRWLNGTRRPVKDEQEEFKRIFSVKPSYNLEKDPIFMSYEYFGFNEIIEWGNQRKERVVESFDVIRRLIG
ncbi:hypothetical protein [Spirosoma spitsbergense]|uniref:hypothetical protein n=1 Tax=Spirosoma spitsbergense TaxID=431554 RepID=UPI00036FE3FD|nr:hypothetical protein [Spirosoma spitsbergense]